jgi:hydrogenase nickel incorporation protein HypA/HybF
MLPALHELSIAHSLVEAAAAAALAAGARRVHEVRVVVGALSGVAPDALLFSYDVAAAGTTLEGSRLTIREVPVTIHCPECDLDSPIEGALQLRCPRCDRPSFDVRSGRELLLESLEADCPED